MASFNGTDLGPACIFSTAGAPVQLQIFAYPAINGIGANILGDRGGLTQGTGVLCADNYADLANIEDSIRTLQTNATTGPFIDAYGDEWDNCLILQFQPADTIPEDAPGTGVARAYSIQILHLSM